ncbi:MAG: DUF2764 family protein [Tidjanibacter sp.]|nr:DUF2764 family protein [Tidjanibacter sp.]
MATNYYCLVAGLKEYTLDGDVKGFDARVVIDEIADELSKADRKALGAHLLLWDVCNLVNLRSGREGFSTLGNLSREELQAELEVPTVLPAELREVISLYAEMEGGEVDADDERLQRIDTSKSFEAAIFAAYYRYCAQSRCRFVREWAEADRNLRNITAALTARQRGLNIADVVVGGGDVVAQLSRSSAADFGLKGELTYVDNLIAALGDNQDLLDKEHRIDLIRWNMAEELATFDYFNINFLLSYVARLGLVHRWAMLDAERGKEMFRRLVGSLGAKEQIAEAERRYAAE